VTINVPDPRDTSLERWCAELALQDSSVPLPPDPIGWQRWAAFVAQFTTLSVLDLPNPYGFTDWRGWATRVKELAS
jgi:hypothetical protein